MGSKGKKAPAFNHEDEFPLAIKREYFQAAKQRLKTKNNHTII